MRKNRQSCLMQAIQKLSERDLTVNVLVPLFKIIGYERVEYSGGPYEQGKDIVCWRRDELGELELAVAQVKLYKPVRSASKSRSLQTIINQLYQASEIPLPHPETQMPHRPTIVYFITPFQIDTLMLQSTFSTFPALRRCRLKIVDGAKLASLLNEKAGDLAVQLLGTETLVIDAVTRQLTNETLLRALDLRSGRHVEDFYTEIDLALGQLSAQLLFRASFEPRSELFKLKPRSWRQVRSVRDMILDQFRVDIITSSIESTEDNFGKIYEKHSAWKREHEKQVERHKDIEATMIAAEGELTEKAKYLVIKGLVAFGNHSGLVEAVRSYQSRRNSLEERRKQVPTIKVLQRISDLEIEIADLAEKLGEAIGEISPLIGAMDAATEIFSESQRDIEISSKNEPELYFEARIDVSPFISNLLNARKLIIDRIKILNSSNPSPKELRRLLVECRKLLAVLQQSSNVAELMSAMNPSIDPESSLNKATRIGLGIQRILDTRLNFLILGEAGAGKTTSLQMYAYRKVTAETCRELVLFIPVVRLMKLIPQTSTLNRIAAFASSMGISMTERSLGSELERGGTILIDGIDEVLSEHPDILAEIEGLASRFQSVQWVISARTSGHLTFSTDFIPVTLLPFSNVQVNDFIFKWFDDERESVAKEVLAHLKRNKNIAEVTRNPLLLTILCVLGDHGIPLPNTEMRLYRDRFDLFTGRYDLHKKVMRLRTRQENLLSLAQYTAYRLHHNRSREMHIDELYLLATEMLGAELGPDRSRQALDELIDPCNVLVPMSLDQRFGFGHLRYQEYLAARELKENRGPDAVGFLDDPWWRGALLLFAGLSGSLSWFLKIVCLAYEGRRLPAILNEMVMAGPPKERDGLAWLLSDLSRRRQVQ